MSAQNSKKCELAIDFPIPKGALFMMRHGKLVGNKILEWIFTLTDCRINNPAPNNQVQ